MTEKKRLEIEKYWKETKKDAKALQRTCELFDATEEEVKEIIRGKRTAPFWDEEKVTKLKAYLAQGMKNAEIANQLGCTPQAVADYKKRHKEELAPFINAEKGKLATEPPATSTKETTATSNDSVPEEQYTTERTECQEESQEVCEECLCTITTEDYDKLYTAYEAMYLIAKERLNSLADVGELLTVAEYIGNHMPKNDTSEKEYSRCCATILKAALKIVNDKIYTERA